MSLLKETLWTVLASFVGLAVSAQAFASDYPNKPIRLIAPYAAGGLSDILARMLANELSERLQQSVIVENRVGAGGIIGTDYVARSRPDGYTLGLVGQGLASVNPGLYKDLPYDTLKDFVPLTTISKFSMVLVGNPEQSPKTIDEVIEFAKANPGKLNYGSAGNASTAHLTMALLNDQIGTQMLHVPYKGESPAFTELVGGRIDLLFATVGGALPLIKSGKLNPIAIADRSRNALLVDVPTIDESRVKGFEAFGWYVVLAPTGVPEQAVQTLSTALMEIGKSEKFRQAMQARGMEAIGSTPEEAKKMIADETERWGAVIKKVGITTN